MNRRTFLPAAGLSAAALHADLKAQQQMPAPARKGRLKQSLCRWCFSKIPIEDLAPAAAKLGIQSIDLIDVKEWDAIRKHGLTPTMVTGGMTIENGLNRKENHEALLPKLRESIDRAAANKVPSVIVFSGNRRGMADEEGWENCRIGLQQVVKQAEDKGVLVCMELLNSKVNHKDYMCDKTPWGVELVKRVNSPAFKLLYDIYHMQIMEGDVIRTIKDNYQHIGHFHTAGVPGRHELDTTQELYYPAIAKAIADLNFQGYFAHEFIPLRDPIKSLAEAVTLCDV